MRGFITRSRMELRGYLGGVPELRFTPSGKPVLDMSIAVGGGKDYPGRWYKATFWAEDAEGINQLDLKKGYAIVVVGNLVESDNWIGKDGQAKGKAKLGWIDLLKYESSGELVAFELNGSKKDKPVEKEPAEKEIEPEDIPF